MARPKPRGAAARTTKTRPASGARFTRLEVDARRAQLVALGLEIFSRSPYDAVSLDDVARRAGLSKGLFYHYFPSKRAYYIVSIREAARQLLARTDTPDTVPPTERLARGLDAFLDYVEAHEGAYTALMRGGIGSDREVAALVEETRASFLEKLIAGLPGLVLTPRVRVTLRGWIAFVESASLDHVERKDLDREALRDLLVAALLELLRVAH